ncbi:MAG: DUF423 domain-containing protein [Xanthomonadales bacterium]|nr:DUF423 domain-containing protein [Xanthomonadales bacterium]
MQRTDRLILAAGALALAAGTAAAAAAAHIENAVDASRLGSTSQMLLIHGLGLIVLAVVGEAWPALKRPSRWTAALLALGLALFCGSLLLAVAADTSTSLAPLGGGLIMLSWLIMLLAALCHPLAPKRPGGEGGNSV